MKTLITDNQRITGATTQFGSPIKIYDDGFGPLFILRDSMRIVGIVRAQTWEDAYGIAEDELFPEASDSLDDLKEEYGEDFWDDACFQEAYGFRPNGPNATDTEKHGIYAKDLNGGALDELTPSLVERLEIALQIENWE